MNRIKADPAMWMNWSAWQKQTAKTERHISSDFPWAALSPDALWKGLQDPNFHFILIGTGQPDPWSLKFAGLLMNREVKKYGYYTPTKLTRKLLFDNYNKKFKNADNSIEWLLKDKKAQQEYLQDKNILTEIPCGYFKDMLDGMILAQKTPDFRKIVNISGTEDPVGSFGHDMEKLRKQYPNLINMPVSGGRHDVLHDTCRNSVLKLITQSIREWNQKTDIKADQTEDQPF